MMTENGLEETYVDPKDRVLDPSLISSTLLDRMPSPTGWRLLILPYRGKGKTEGGILLPDKLVEEGYAVEYWGGKKKKNKKEVDKQDQNEDVPFGD